MFADRVTMLAEEPVLWDGSRLSPDIVGDTALGKDESRCCEPFGSHDSKPLLLSPASCLTAWSSLLCVLLALRVRSQGGSSQSPLCCLLLAAIRFLFF